jgi:hypothetical protein
VLTNQSGELERADSINYDPVKIGNQYHDPGCQSFLATKDQNWENMTIDHKITKWPKMYTKWPSQISNGFKRYQHFPFQGHPPKYNQKTQIYHLATQTRIGVKIYYLATKLTISALK